MNLTSEDYVADKLAGKLQKYALIEKIELRGVITICDPPVRMKVNVWTEGAEPVLTETFEEWKVRKENEHTSNN